MMDKPNKRQMLFSIGFIVALYYIVLSVGGFAIFKRTRIPHISVKNTIFALYDNTTIDLYAIGPELGKQTTNSAPNKIFVSNLYPDEAGANITDNTSKLGGGLLSLSSFYFDVSNSYPVLLETESTHFLPYIFIVSFSFLLRGVLKLIYVLYSAKTSDRKDDTNIILRLGDIQLIEQLVSTIEVTVVMRMIGVTEMSTIFSTVFLLFLFETLVYSQHSLYFIYNKEIKDHRETSIQHEYSAKTLAIIMSAISVLIYIIIMCANYGKSFEALPLEWSEFTFTVNNTAIANAVLYFTFRLALCALGLSQLLFGEKMFVDRHNIFTGFQVFHTFLHLAAVTVLAACVFNISIYDEQLVV